MDMNDEEIRLKCLELAVIVETCGAEEQDRRVHDSIVRMVADGFFQFVVKGRKKND